MNKLITKRLLYALPGLAWIVLMFTVAFARYDFVSVWVIALLTSAAIWDPVSERLMRHSNKQQQTVSWKDAAYIIVALVTVVLTALLAGWAVDRLSELLGKWVTISWYLLCVAILAFSILVKRRARRLQSSEGK